MTKRLPLYLLFVMIWSFNLAKGEELSYGEKVYADNRHAVVTILTFDESNQQQRLGSGCITSANGEIVTNYHVIEGAKTLLVKLLTGALFPVDGILALEPDMDFAVLKVSGKELPVVKLDSLDSVKVGQRVFALGSPWGMEQTFSDGMASSLREGTEVQLPKLSKVIQHTAPISPGSSGGPLFNQQGQVLGINTFYFRDGQNLNFAIPMDYVKPYLGRTEVLPLVPERITSKDGGPMVLIPAGKFQMGSNNGGKDEKPVHAVSLDSFYLDVYEVTNVQYGKFMQATGHSAPAYWSDSRFNAPNQPVVGVTWHDAVAYCQWAGKRLPTEAEWEYAARGGLVGREYPWGDEAPNANRANSGQDWSTVKVPKLQPVGSYPANGYGLYDMAGNVWERCADWYDSSYYVQSPKQNPTGPGSGQFRVLRGGSWFWFNAPAYLRVANRYFSPPSGAGSGIGFRCAQD